MAIGSKMFAVTVLLAAFLGSGVGVVLAPWATEQIRARTGVDLAARSAPGAVPLATAPPGPIVVYPYSGVYTAVPPMAPGTPPPPAGAMPPTPSRVLPGAALPSSSATGTPASEDELPPLPNSGRSPFNSDSTAQTPGDVPKPGGVPAPDDPPMSDEADLMAAAAAQAELPLPADYFDITKLASTKGDGTDAPVLKPGQYLQVEVIEALPGRPISGIRVIRPDGTISLGFYGDLTVAGLNRHQIKVKLLEHLDKFISHQVLGFEGYHEDKRHLIPAAETNRVFVDESLNFEPSATIPAPTRAAPSDATGDLRDQIKALNAKVEHLLGREPKPK